jgi:hypothetical protein
MATKPSVPQPSSCQSEAEVVYASHVERLTDEAQKELQAKLPSIMRRAYFDMLVQALDELAVTTDPEKREKTLQMFLGLYGEIRGYLVKAACEGKVDETFEPLPSVTHGERTLVRQINRSFDPVLFERIIRHNALDRGCVLSMVHAASTWLRILLFKPLVARFEKDVDIMVEALRNSELSLGKATSVALDKLFYWLD